MRKFYLTLFISICTIICHSQYKFALQINTSTLDGKKVNLTLLQNNAIQVISKMTSTFKSKTLYFGGVLTQPCNVADLSFTNNGVPIYYRLALDSGKHVFNLDVVQGKRTTLSISDLKTNSFKIDAEIKNLFLNKLDIYKKESGLSNAVSLPKKLESEFNLAVINYLTTYQNEYYSLLKLNQFSSASSSIEWSDKILLALDKLSKNLQKSPLGQLIYSERHAQINALTQSKVGNQVHYFTLKDSNQNLFTNHSLLGQNYIIVFSATWCIPCQNQLPQLKKIYDLYKSDGLKLIYFNNDADVTLWKEHILKNKLTWINVSERLKPSLSKIQKSFGVYSIPTCLLIDKKGTIIYNSDQDDNDLKQLGTSVSNLFNAGKVE